MEELMRNEATMTSLQIAEITGKPHNDLMKAIRKMEPAWEKINQGNFSLVTYTDSKGEKRPCYSLTKTECLYIATKFNDEARAKLVLRWKELEEQRIAEVNDRVPKTFSKALLLAAQLQEQVEQQTATIAHQQQAIGQLTNTVAEMKEKVSYLDQILASKSTVAITQIAQDYGMSAVKFNKILSGLHIQHKVGKQWILYAPYISEGYVHSEPIPKLKADGTPFTVTLTKWTQRGRLFLYQKLKDNDIIPLIEK